MSVTLNQPQLIRSNRDGSAVYRLSWSSSLDDPTYYLYDLSTGKLLYSGPQPGYTLVSPAGVPLTFWVTDDNEESLPATYPGRMTLRWYEVTNASYYLIEEYVDAVWTVRARVPEDGRWVYNWQSRYLEDATTHEFRISAVDTAGNASAVVAFSELLVRRPDPPQVEYSYDEGTKKVTISEA